MVANWGLLPLSDLDSACGIWFADVRNICSCSWISGPCFWTPAELANRYWPL